ncbi:hypothetical protein [Amycolatopsis samaneae]|uniref:Uncharacterized protein n=1 Tax=Amycolatopsis samaneae TaxID=664691 RepID=A0ABW5GA69_9PSEU
MTTTNAAEKVPNNGASQSGSTPTPSEPSPNPVAWTVKASESPRGAGARFATGAPNSATP